MTTYTVTLCLLLCVWTVDMAAEKSLVRQKRAWIIDSFSIEEESPGPFPYSLGVIELERNYLVNFLLHGSGVDEDPKDVLDINKKTGEILVYKKVDYETFRFLRLRFEAVNVSNNEVDTRLGVEIKIRDINDHTPKFQQQVYERAVEESISQGETLVTVFASDADDNSTPNGTFSFRIVSVSPETKNAEFFIKNLERVPSGTISFKGCLDYETAQKYSILVEAKDHGDKVQLSSTTTVMVNIIDKNNHLPKITGQTGSGSIKERESGIEVLRFQVTDKDSHGSPAWKARYTIHGDKGKYFKIETDPETNEGILTVQKPIDYEEFTEKNISIGVENEEPYFSCKIKNRVKTGLWDVETSSKQGSGIKPKLYPVTIKVEDVNDPPFFKPIVKHAMVMENSEVGLLLETFTAIDLDGSYANKFQYLKESDPADWVTVDSKTGQVFTAKVIDRESPFVNDSTYTVTLSAVDYGEPPMTGTGTLIIHIKDQNDNVPVLSVNTLDMCLSDEPTRTNLTAIDPDISPYSGPFHFELIGDVEGKWRFDPSYGMTVDLIKDSTVYAGHHELLVRVSDNQGHESLQNLSVTVCDCSETPTCHIRRSSTSKMGGGSIGIIIFALLMLLALMLLAILISCKEAKPVILMEDGPEWHLLPSNTETPGTDCEIPPIVQQVDPNFSVKRSTSGKWTKINSSTIKQDVMQNTMPVSINQVNTSKSIKRTSSEKWIEMASATLNQNAMYSSIQQVTPLQSSMAFQQQGMYGESLYRSSTKHGSNTYYQDFTISKHSTYNGEALSMRGETLSAQIDQKLHILRAPGEELGDYAPHVYAEEGESVADAQLDVISIPESDFGPDKLKNLDHRFNTLASICRPHLIEAQTAS